MAASPVSVPGARQARSAPAIVFMAMTVAGVILVKRRTSYTQTQNVGHAVGLIVTLVGLTFLADIGGGTIAAGLAILIVLAIAYKEKPASVAPAAKSSTGAVIAPATGG